MAEGCFVEEFKLFKHVCTLWLIEGATDSASGERNLWKKVVKKVTAGCCCWTSSRPLLFNYDRRFDKLYYLAYPILLATILWMLVTVGSKITSLLFIYAEQVPEHLIAKTMRKISLKRICNRVQRYALHALDRRKYKNHSENAVGPLRPLAIATGD